MISDTFDLGTDVFTRNLIRYKVRRLIGRAGFQKQDREPLTQEFYVKLWNCMPSFDPTKGHRHAFIRTVVESCYCNLLRNKLAGKRDDRRVASLNSMISDRDKGAIELGKTISARQLEARLGQFRRSEVEQASMRMDIAQEIAKLTPDHQRLLELLKKVSMTEACRRMKISRAKAYRWLRKIRERFTDAGLRDYL